MQPGLERCVRWIEWEALGWLTQQYASRARV
jgi:hypothetical protein